MHLACKKSTLRKWILESIASNVRHETQPLDGRPWADLRIDVLGLIYDRLFPIDRVAFAVVCRSWRQYASSRPRPSFPLILPQIQGALEGRLRSPFHNNVYLPYRQPEAGFVFCRGSVGSWLLYYKSAQGQRPFFVDHALKNKWVHLPPWRWPWRWTPLYDAIISAAPTADDCTVVFLSANRIFHCKVNDQVWSFCEVDTCLEKSTGAFLRGKLCIIDEHQRLGVVAFGKIENAVTWLGMDVGPLQERLGLPIEYGRHFLMESSGTLLLAFLGQGRCWYVFRADLIEMTWRGVEDLEDRSLFLAPSRSVSAVAIEAGVEANRLYFARGETSNAPLENWISVATHRGNNCWKEISFLRYNTDAPRRATRWVFQPVVVIDADPHARRTC